MVVGKKRSEEGGGSWVGARWEGGHPCLYMARGSRHNQQNQQRAQLEIPPSPGPGSLTHARLDFFPSHTKKKAKKGHTQAHALLHTPTFPYFQLSFFFFLDFILFYFSCSATNRRIDPVPCIRPLSPDTLPSGCYHILPRFVFALLCIYSEQSC